MSDSEITPATLLNPLGANLHDGASLDAELERSGIDRLTVERSGETQTIRRDGESWRLTCRNALF